MASFREVLSFLITADGTQAVKEFDKVAKASNASMAATEGASKFTAAGFTRIGAAASATAVVAGAVLFKAAQAAGDLEKSMARVDAAFGKSADSVKEFAKGARFLADVDAAKFAADIGEAATGMGLTADAAADLTPKVVDVASKLAVIKGLDMGTALESVSAALRGEYDATQRLVPALSAARIEQEAMAATGKTRAKDLTTAEKAQSALNIIIEDGTKIVEKNGEALNSQSAKSTEAAARMKDAWTGFGAGALPIVEKLTGGVLAMADGFAGLDEKTQGAAGNLAAFAVAGVGVVGMTSLIIGQVMKMGDRFGTLKDKLYDAETGLTRMGKVAQGAALGGLALGLFAVAKAANEASRDVDAAATSVKEFDLAKGAKGQIEAVQKIGTDLASNADKVADFFGMFNEAAASVDLAGVTVQLDTFTRGIDDLKKTNPQGAIDAINIALKSLEGQDLDLNQQVWRDELIATRDELLHTAEVEKALAEQQKAGAVTTGMSADATQRWAESAADAALSAEDQAKANEKLNDTFSDLVDNGKSAAEMMLDISDATKQAAGGDLADSLEKMDFDESARGALDMGEALGTMKEKIKGLPADFNEADAALGKYDEAQRDAITSTLDYADAAKAQAAVVLQTTGDQAKAFDVLKAAQKEIIDAGGADFLERAGLTDQQIDLAIKLSGEEEARERLRLLATDWSSVEEEFRNPIEILLQNGQAQAALDLLAARSAELRSGAENPIIVTLLAQAETAAATGDLDKAAAIARTTKLIAEADAAKATGELDEAAYQERIAEILAWAPPDVRATVQAQLDAIAEAKRQADIKANPTNVAGASATIDGVAKDRTANITLEAQLSQRSRNLIAWATGQGATVGTSMAPAPPVTATPHTTNVTVNMPAGINGRDVERTMRRYAARNGVRVR